jgi:leucyl aminopeptidase
MRPVFLAVLAAALAAAASPAAAAPLPGESLYLIESPTAGTAGTLLAADVMVVRDFESRLLVIAGPDRRAVLDELGLRATLLAPSVEGKTFYTVMLRGASLAERVPGVRILWADTDLAVIEATPEEADLVTGHFEIARIFMRPIRLAPAAKPALRPELLVPDPVIQQMVDMVTGANIDATVLRLQNFRTRRSTTDSCRAAGRWVSDQFLALGITDVSFHTWSATYAPNVVATIPGTRFPDQIVVLGAHYDSYSSSPGNEPGADDDASGVGCLLECARIVSQFPHDYTITFIAFSGEEQGLLGSEAYANMARQNGDDILGMVQVDMIGYLAGGDVLDLDIITNSSSSWIRDLVIQVGNIYNPGFSIVTGNLTGGSSDHASFWAAGYDAILFFEDTGSYSPYIHTTNDVIGTSYNSPVLAVNSVKSAVALIATMAEAPALTMAHTVLHSTTDHANPYTVTANVFVNEGTLDVARLYYRIDGGAFVPVDMTNVGPDTYAADVPAQANDVQVQYYIYSRNSGGYETTIPAGAPATLHAFYVATAVDELEVASGWTVGAPGDNATAGIWIRVDPVGTAAQPEDDYTPPPGVMCYVTGQGVPGGSVGAADVDGGTTTLLTPVYDLSQYTQMCKLSYERWYSNNQGGSPNLDNWVVDISNDGGATWTSVENVNPPNTLQNTWVNVLVDVVALFGTPNQVRLRFKASDLGSGSVVEAAVDDLVLLTRQGSSTVEDPAASAPIRFAVGPNQPNPFNPQTTITYSLPERGEVTVTIFDVAGRAVRALFHGVQPAGEQAIVWTGRDDAGQPVASGVYYYRVDALGQSAVRKMALVKSYGRPLVKR